MSGLNGQTRDVKKKNQAHIYKFFKGISEEDNLPRHPDAMRLYFLCELVRTSFINELGRETFS